MRHLTSTVAWRYLAIAAQFFVVVLVTQNTSLAVAGTYFSLFGLVSVAFVLVGAGVPDGAVVLASALRSRSDGGSLRQLIAGGIVVSCASSIAIASGAAVAFSLTTEANALTVALVSVWWLHYACVFALAQFVVAVGRVGWGSFIAYSAINIAYLVTLVPYLIITPNATLNGMLGAAVCGSGIALLVGLFASWGTIRQELRALPHLQALRMPTTHLLTKALRYGFPLSVARLLQASFPWVPVWILALSGNPEGAAVYAAASRLTVVVTSLIGSIRFGARPQIGLLNETQQFTAIAKLSRHTTYLTAIPPLLAVVFLATIGSAVVPAVLGSSYEVAVPVLMALMIGVLGEALGGLSDEILKMTRRGSIVIASQLASSAFQILLCVSLASGSPLNMAIVTGLAFVIQYALQVAWLSLATPIHIWSFKPGQDARKTEEKDD